ncbi:segregation and condensation protein A [Actinospica durhamensis]|uniref:segregation and condensation protein A n=1 Tax=Actinospica durhamensis TaxID=1508375 RepID=UPI0027DCEA5F|nr:segregation/condensation protein A [Actinospica durhamensis]
MEQSVAEAAADAAEHGPASAAQAEPEDPSVFRVHLAEFQGPFDLLLSLIAKHKLDVTTLALSQVTDDFIAHIRAQGPDWDLDAASEFLLIAATLLDLKAARLLPSAEVENEEDLALLEARDLLFARLLQYRAYKQVAARLAERYAHGSLRHPRSVPLEAEFRDLLPELVFALTPEQFAKLAVKAMTPKVAPQVSIAHIHQIQVSVREQAAIVVEKLRVLRSATFQTLVEDAPDTLHVVARFLALLELFRERAVGFDQDQETAYAELTVHWTGDDSGDVEVDGGFDEEDASLVEGADAAPGPERGADFSDITELTGIAESEYGDQEDES